LLLLAAMIILSAPAAWADADHQGEVIRQFKALPSFQAVELSWRFEFPLPEKTAFQIFRSQGLADGPYVKAGDVPFVKGKLKHTYVDKNVRKGTKYYYRLILSEGAHSYGPISAKPFFVLPTT
jgi:hypothetical protein